MNKYSFLERRLDRELQSAASEELSDYLLVGSFKGLWTIRTLPFEVKSTELAEQYAKDLVFKEDIPVILVRSGREFVHFHREGRKTRTFVKPGASGKGTVEKNHDSDSQHLGKRQP